MQRPLNILTGHEHAVDEGLARRADRSAGQAGHDGGGSDITDITETYREFTVDAKMDAKAFTLPQ